MEPVAPTLFEEVEKHRKELIFENIKAADLLQKWLLTFESERGGTRLLDDTHAWIERNKAMSHDACRNRTSQLI